MDLRNYVRILTGQNKTEGTLYEPRLYFDTFVFDGTRQQVTSNPDVFKNGEKRPVRLTHILAAVRMATATQAQPLLGDERAIQRYGMRIFSHGSYYQSSRYVQFPCWVNKPVAASDVTTEALSTWNFAHPVIMGRRDFFTVEVALEQAAALGAQRVTVAFDGVGMFTRQPKRLVGYIDLTTTVPDYIPSQFFRNDGVEPLEIHSVTLMQSSGANDPNAMGNVRNVQMRLRLDGNGSNQWWVTGPAIPVTLPRAPGALWGPESGRAIVHKIPGDGWLWYSSEGLTIELQALSSSAEQTVLVALLGEAILS